MRVPFWILTWLAGSWSAIAGVAPSGVELVSQVTGAGSTNDTDERWAVHATDLGIPWATDDGRVLIAFGDTYGPGWGGFGAGPESADWRSNVLAVSTDADVTDGLSFDAMIEDAPGHAAELLPALRLEGVELTVIPTAGITIGGRHYLHYMSINRWTTPGRWIANHSGVAYSDDDGRTWSPDPALQWSGDGGFVHGAFVRDGDVVYLFGLPAGRFGEVSLARVAATELLEVDAWEYWDGVGWSSDEGASAPIVPAPVGETSVLFNAHLGRWLMTYLDEDRAAIVLRDAPALVGPWTGERILVRGSEYPALYGAYLHPWFADTEELVFLMSQWGPYNVFLMRAEVTTDEHGDDQVSDPGFEDQTTGALGAPWRIDGAGGVDLDLGNAHGGANNAFLRSTSGTHAVRQSVALRPHTGYRLSAWLRSSQARVEGTLGVRMGGDAVLHEIAFDGLEEYTPVTVDLDSGTTTLAELVVGFTARGEDAWVQIDDASLVENDELVADGGFEMDDVGEPPASWATLGQVAVARDGRAHSGAGHAVLAASTLPAELAQSLVVTPGSGYRATVQVRAAQGEVSGSFGLRDADGRPWRSRSFTAATSWLSLELDLDSDHHTELELYVRTRAVPGPRPDRFLLVDGVSVRPRPQLVLDPGFEDRERVGAVGPWVVSGSGGIDRDLGLARTGRNNAWLRSTSGTHELRQSVDAVDGDDYVLQAWVRGSAGALDTAVGVRGADGTLLAERRFAAEPGYTPVYVPFDSGASGTIEAFVQLVPDGSDVYVQIDDVSVRSLHQRMLDPGFEDQLGGTVGGPWRVEGSGGIDSRLGLAHRGANNAWLRDTAGRHAIVQSVSVVPWTSYRLRAWVRSSDTSTEGTLGARRPDGTLLREVALPVVPEYTPVELHFSSRDAEEIELFAAIEAAGVDTWLQIDDVSLHVTEAVGRSNR